MRWIGCVAILLLTASLAAAEVKSRDTSLDAIVPREAYEGVGGWSSGEYFVVTGHSTAITSLGAAKGKRTETIVAHEDAERRIAVQAAMADHPDFDEDNYEVKSTIGGFQTAATFTLQGREGLFLIGVAKKNDVHVEVAFSPAKARQKAILLFDSGHYSEAAARFATLSQRGVQDAETIGYARAASWHVNLDAGISGDSRAESLNGLAHFYLVHKDYEASVQQFHALYRETPEPSRELLDTLLDLCVKTHRDKTAAGLRSEISRRWPTTMPVEKPPAIKSAQIEEPYAAVLAKEFWLLTDGGAAVVSLDGANYFIAVGFTKVREDSPDERLRQLRVAQQQALKEAFTLVERNTVIVHDELHETTVITDEGGKKSAKVTKTLDAVTVVKVKAALRSPPQVGTWKSEDGVFFFCAIAQKLD